MSFEILSNLSEVAAAFKRASATAPVSWRTAVNVSALGFTDTMTRVVKEHTPVSKVGPTLGERLVDTTDTTQTGATNAGIAITTRQTKRVTFKGGGSMPLYQLLTEGHAAPAQGISPLRPKFGLMWPGLAHPVGFSKGGPAEPNPYGADARAEIAPLASEWAGALAEGWLTRLTETLKI